MEDFAGKATVVLAVIAGVFLLYWGAPFFIPLLVALSYNRVLRVGW